MKRFWLVLLSLGLIMAFSTSAFAVDVKFSGSYYAAGLFLNRTTLNDDSASNGPSTAFYFQRLRVQTQFVVTPGLNLITRFDALERVWGSTRSTPTTTAGTYSMGTTAENENIAIDYAYIKYDTPAGSFRVGAMPAGTWGTVFGDTSYPAWRVFWMSNNIGGFNFLMLAQKYTENSYTTYNTTAVQADKDKDGYFPAIWYTAKNWNAGVLGGIYMDSTNRTNTATDYKSKYYLLNPYAKANFGPVAIQTELLYYFGKQKEYDNAGAGTDVKYDSMAYWIDATATFGPVYVGGTFAYARGENADTTDVTEQVATGGLDWSPTLIMFNEDRYMWIGTLKSGATAAGFGNGMANAYFYQIKAGVKPTDKLDIMASVAYATADTTPADYVSKNYGYEIDVTGTYKITNNLSYMLGVGYLLTGDYFKGTDSSNKVANDYLVINKLTLTF